MRFFDKFQDRILFGTDAILDTPDKLRGRDHLYEIYYRFLESDDDYFETGSSVHWRIYGIKQPESVLRKVYYENAERVFGLRA
jgi:predicted TIM-barrel fold metal-dependent hydrolase